MTDQALTGLSEGRVGRYSLEDLVVESSTGSQFWRASDPALRRPVGARLIPRSDPRVPRVRDAARTAARVHDRRVVQVLDVVETPEYLAVITEWVIGRPWSDVLEAEQPTDAVVIAYEVARALQAAHALGVTHGRLRPASVLVSETKEVRLRGLQVDAALYGVAPGQDARLADLHGVGAILYLGLTGRWPDPEHRSGTIDGIAIIGPVGGRVPAADELVSGVPPQLSRLASMCMISATGQRPQMPDIDHAVASLGRVLGGGDRSGSTALLDFDEQAPDRMIRRLALLAVAAIALAGGALVVGALRPGAEVAPPAQSPSPSASQQPPSTGVAPQPLPMVSVTDFDPEGEDGEENPQLAPLAIDGDLDTAWNTVSYKSSGMDPKGGTGLLIDLGLIRPIREIRLDLLGSDTDVEIRVSDTPGQQAKDYELLAGAVAAGPQVVFRTPVPVDVRYVLVWLTSLPYSGRSYQGGIREVQILG